MPILKCAAFSVYFMFHSCDMWRLVSVQTSFPTKSPRAPWICHWRGSRGGDLIVFMESSCHCTHACWGLTKIHFFSYRTKGKNLSEFKCPSSKAFPCIRCCIDSSYQELQSYQESALVLRCRKCTTKFLAYHTSFVLLTNFPVYYNSTSDISGGDKVLCESQSDSNICRSGELLVAYRQTTCVLVFMFAEMQLIQPLL